MHVSVTLIERCPNCVTEYQVTLNRTKYVMFVYGVNI